MTQLVKDWVLYPLNLTETALPGRDSDGILPAPAQAAFAGDTCHDLVLFPGIDMDMLGIPKYSDLSRLSNSYAMSGTASGMHSTCPDLLQWAKAGCGDALQTSRR